MAWTAQKTYLMNTMNETTRKCNLGTELATIAAASIGGALATGSGIIGVAGVATAIDLKGDGKILIGNGTTAAAQSVSGDITITNAGVTAIGAGKVLESMIQVPSASSYLGLQRLAKVVFDPSNVVGDRTAAAHTYAITLPANSIIIRSFYDVCTSFTSGTSVATVAISCENANNILSAAGIGAGLNQGMHEGVSTGTVANMKKLVAGGLITVTVAGEALTAGKMVIFVEYVVTAVNV